MGRTRRSQECSDPLRHLFCDSWPGLIVEHLYVKFDDPSGICFLVTVLTNRPTSGGENHTVTTTVYVGKYSLCQPVAEVELNKQPFKCMYHHW